MNAEDHVEGIMRLLCDQALKYGLTGYRITSILPPPAETKRDDVLVVSLEHDVKAGVIVVVRWKRGKLRKPGKLRIAEVFRVQRWGTVQV